MLALPHYPRPQDSIQLGKLRIQITVALLHDLALLWPKSTHRPSLSVSNPKFVDHLHGADPTEGSKALGIQECIVLKVDKDLGGTGIGTCHGKSHHPLLIGLLGRIIWNRGL